GLPSRTGGRVAEGGRRPQPQHDGADRPDRPWCARMGRADRRTAIRRQPWAPGGAGMTASLEQVLATADVIHDRASVDRAIAAMAADIAKDYEGTVPVYLTVMHGGMPFAAQLAMELGVLRQDLEFDYLHATRYRGGTSGGELVWKHRPATALQGRR